MTPKLELPLELLAAGEEDPQTMRLGTRARPRQTLALLLVITEAGPVSRSR